jgi:hypothetical protein
MEAKEITDEDIRKVGITCRCGMQSIAEVPEQFARLTNIHMCPKCKAAFLIKQVDENWKIHRLP